MHVINKTDVSREWLTSARRGSAFTQKEVYSDCSTAYSHWHKPRPHSKLCSVSGPWLHDHFWWPNI